MRSRASSALPASNLGQSGCKALRALTTAIRASLLSSTINTLHFTWGSCLAPNNIDICARLRSVLQSISFDISIAYASDNSKIGYTQSLRAEPAGGPSNFGLAAMRTWITAVWADSHALKSTSALGDAGSFCRSISASSVEQTPSSTISPRSLDRTVIAAFLQCPGPVESGRRPAMSCPRYRVYRIEAHRAASRSPPCARRRNPLGCRQILQPPPQQPPSHESRRMFCALGPRSARSPTQPPELCDF